MVEVIKIWAASLGIYISLLFINYIYLLFKNRKKFSNGGTSSFLDIYFPLILKRVFFYF